MQDQPTPRADADSQAHPGHALHGSTGGGPDHHRGQHQRGNGHAFAHQYHHGSSAAVTGARRYIPTFPTSTLVAVIAAFMLGGRVVSLAAEDEKGTDGGGHATPHPDALTPAKSGTS